MQSGRVWSVAQNLNYRVGFRFKRDILDVYICQALYFATPAIIMAQIDRQFWHIARAFLIRYHEYNRQKNVSPAQLEEFDHLQAKMLSQQELKQSVITKLTSIELKSDYHNLILLAFLQDLAKWSQDYSSQLLHHPAPVEAILTQSLHLLNSQQPFHTIVAKQNQLISTLLPLEYTLAHMQQYKQLYRKLKDIKQYFPLSIRQHQKKCFLNAVEESIDRAAKLHNIKVIQFVFSNIFNELEVLEENHEFVTQRLKVMKKIVQKLWTFHEDIIYKMAYLLMKVRLPIFQFSYQIIGNPHLYSHVLPIYDLLLEKLLQQPAVTALLLFRHLILNNIQKLLKSSSSSCILLEGLLNELSRIFTKSKLQYFMRHYDWNYLQISICQESLNMLYQYCQNRTNQKKVEHELVKTYLNRIHNQIKHYLEQLRGVDRDDSKWKFYTLKKKEYQELVVEMNEEPKTIFKRLEQTKNREVRESMIQKYVRIIKKTAHLDNRAMINLMSNEKEVSGQIFSAYAELVLKQCREHNLEEFIRLFTSNFFLTGQSQQIARILDTITQFYYKRQQKQNLTLKSSDATYTFANAILILNTDLHNPKNEEKISEESFIKMCKKINEGEDIPVDVLRKTYLNIKKNKINTFRDRGDMLGISVSNWLAMCTDYESLPLPYYDHELEALDEPCLQYFIHDLLSSIIDEKETAKLELLVQRFNYDDKVFECEIIEVIRKVIEKKPHLPLHILEKIFELANFKHNKPSEKTLSYYWLAANVITSFPALIPINVICEFLVLTWDIRTELQDNLHLRQIAQIKRIKQCIKSVTKRDAKKSIMDMFSNFLSFKESDDEEQPQATAYSRRNNFKAISNNVLDVVRYQEGHKKIAVEFLFNYIHNEESKVYEEFLSCLFLTFNLLHLTDNCEQMAQDLFYELLGVKESSITKRLANLGKKDPKLYNILTNYCRFWILKLLLKEYRSPKLTVKENNSYEYMLTKSLEYLDKVDKEILLDLMKEVIGKQELDLKIRESFERAIEKVYGKDAKNHHQEVQVFIEKFCKKEEEKEKEKETGKEDNEKKDKQEKEGKEKIGESEKEKQEKIEEKPVQDNHEIKHEQESKIQSCEEKVEKDKNKAEKDEPQLPQQQQLNGEKNITPTFQKSQLEQSPNKNLPKESSVSLKEPETLPVGSKKDINKKHSLEHDEEDYIDPDAVIDQIDREIEHHRKEVVTPSKPPEGDGGDPTKQKKEQKEEVPSEVVAPVKAEGSQQAESPSIPVIMF